MSIESKNVIRRLESMADVDLQMGVRKAIKLVQVNAKSMCPERSGELRQSIMAEVTSTDETITGTCYSNKRYAPYVELGTGPIGEDNHAGISPAINPVYTQFPWWIHESQIDKELAERYHWFKVETEKGIFYLCAGQPAHPFLYPAIKNNEDRVMQIITEETRKELN